MYQYIRLIIFVFMNDSYKDKSIIGFTSNSKHTKWGGSWTELKLDAFTKYVNAYLTIMNRNREKFNWKLIYFDGFAGSGCREETMDDSTSVENEMLLFDENVKEEELCVYKCAAERILNIEQKGFDFYYFIDINKASNDALKARLLQYQKPGIQLEYRNEDANHQIWDLAHALHDKKNLRALVLLDPFGMQLDWVSIERLAHTKIDLWILIPTGVIVNRLLDKKGELVYLNKLKSFLGMTEEEIRLEFYLIESEQTLFGETSNIIKVGDSINRIARLYISKLKTIFEEVSDEPLVLLNSKKVPIYHFAFASSNATAKKIVADIIGSM